MADRLRNNACNTIALVRNTERTVVKASGEITATGQTAAVDVADYTEGLLFVKITALTAVTTIDFTVETYDGAEWFNMGLTIAQQTATGELLIPVTNFGEQIRVTYAMGGAAHTATFAINFIGKS